MAPSAERIVARLMSREPPELEPGDMVWDPQLAMAVAALDKHPFVLAGGSRRAELGSQRLAACGVRLAGDW